MKVQKLKEKNGITLVALVVTIIILLILATVSIQSLTHTGLFTSANKAKLETKRSQITEWLNLKLLETQTSNYNKTAEEIIKLARDASDGNTELTKMGKNVAVDSDISTIEEGEQVDVYFYVQVDEDVYKVEMTGAKFIGEAGKFPPIIKLEKISSTENSITLEVTTKRNEGGILEIYKKTEGETDYTLVKTVTGEEAKELEYILENLEQNKKYNIKIIAKAKNGQIKEFTKEITTAKKLVTEIKITPESAKLNVNEILNLSVTILPEDAYNKGIIWSSSNPEIATVEQDGKVTAIAEGTATITALAQDGSNVKKSCEITVSKELVIFDYKNGGAQYEMEYTSTGYSVGPTISNNEVYGNCTVTSQGWKQLLTKSTFDLTKYKYLYIEGIFRGTYNKFAQLGLNIASLFSNSTSDVYEKYGILPITSEYSSFYIDISENKCSNDKVGIAPKMKGDAVRVLKFTNIKPEGTYAGKIF